MKYKLRFIMILGLIMAFSAMLIAVTAFGVESAMTGVVILAWLIGLSLLDLGITAIVGLSGVLVERYVAAQSFEKRKRNHIDSVLHDLTDSDLMRLKQRLVTGTVDDDVLYDEFMGDDGEFYREIR